MLEPGQASCLQAFPRPPPPALWLRAPHNRANMAHKVLLRYCTPSTNKHHHHPGLDLLLHRAHPTPPSPTTTIIFTEGR